MSTPIYVPGSSVKTRETPFGPVQRLNFVADKLVEFVNANKNANGWIAFEMVPRKQVGGKGETHSLKLDNWEPKKQEGGAPVKAAATKSAAAPKRAATPPPAAEEEVPF